MKFIIGCCILSCVLLLSCVTVQARPQGFDFDNGENPFFPQQQQQQPQQGRRPQNPFFPPSRPQTPTPTSTVTTTAAPVGSTTASPAFLACMRTCPTTSEYNPVCGSNGENYHNNQRLQCAVFCGQNIVAVRSGVCNAL